MKKQPKIHCSHDALVPLAELKPHPRNPNTHPDAQIKLLAEIIRRQGWRAPVVVSKQSGFIVAGHGRVQAAKVAKLDAAPVNYQSFATEAAEIEHLLADNQIAELSETDETILAELIRGCPEIDIDLTGYDNAGIDKIMASDPVADLAALIQTEEEHKLDNAPDPEAIIAALTGYIERLAAQHPERLRGAMAIIIPHGRGQTRDCLILADPACADAAAELRRMAEAGGKSPVAALFSTLIPMKGKDANHN